MRKRSSSVKGADPSNVLFDTWLTARAAIALLDSALAGTGLDAEDFAVYSVLRQAGEISPGELARWMSAPATTVSSHVKRLVARGHVRQVPHPEDRRSYRITLTDAGQHAHTAAGRRFLSALATVEAALPGPASDVSRRYGTCTPRSVRPPRGHERPRRAGRQETLDLPPSMRSRSAGGMVNARDGGRRRIGHTTSDDRAGALAEHGHAAGTDVVVLAVGGGVHADPGPRRHVHVLVQDGAPHVGALADVDAVHQDAVLDPGAALDAHPRRDHRVVHRAAADDTPALTIDSSAPAAEDELGRRLLRRRVKIGQRSL